MKRDVRAEMRALCHVCEMRALRHVCEMRGPLPYSVEGSPSSGTDYCRV